MKYTRENYIAERKQGFINYHLAWEMFSEYEGEKPELNKEQFIQVFAIWCQITPSAIGYFEHFDRVFEIVFVLDKNNKLIDIQ